MNALKKGIQRGTPKSEQEDGRVYMRLDTDQDAFPRLLERSLVVRSTFNRRSYTRKDEDLST